MRFIDTHAHLYLEQFDSDRDYMINSAINKGIDTFLLPNIDKTSIQPMLQLCSDRPEHCHAMMGLHPTSVGADFELQLQLVEHELDQHKYIGVGEIGLDFYWDKTFKQQQLEAFRFQLQLAMRHDLPVAIHTREAFPEILDVVERMQDGKLKGVFHCFSGSLDDAKRIIELNMLMGIGGVITFKKANLAEVVNEIPMHYLLLETDAPFLAPVPFRGKRNESSYLIYIAQKLAHVKNLPLEAVAEATTANATELFNL